MISSTSCLNHSTHQSDTYSSAAIFPPQPLIPQNQEVGIDAPHTLINWDNRPLPPIAVLKLQVSSHSLMTLTSGYIFYQLIPGYFHIHIDHSLLTLISSKSLLLISSFPTQLSTLWSYSWHCYQFTALLSYICILNILSSCVPTIVHHSSSPTLAIVFNANETQKYTTPFSLLTCWCTYSPLLILISMIIIMSLQIPLTPFIISVW